MPARAPPIPAAMDERQKRPDDVGRVSRGTSDRVANMSDAEREELARDFVERKSGVPDAPFRRAVTVTDAVVRRAAVTDEAEVAEAVARLTAELHRTERQLHRIERSAPGGSRYQVGSASPPSGRHARLLSRADRIERELRKLR